MKINFICRSCGKESELDTGGKVEIELRESAEGTSGTVYIVNCGCGTENRVRLKK